MLCEICGKFTDNTITILIDGTELVVCSECKNFGKEIHKRALKKKQKSISEIQFKNSLDEGLDIAQNFGTIVRKAREKKGWTVEDLAKKVFEKESVLHRVEANKFLPSDALLNKLQKTLNIKLRE